ncbi:MAG: nucleotide sugar dehydrogenase [Candidatus Abyssubacteria bacterium]|nr:nucleotide sugar dehydrogenase [Candidatus Abyssubacteria bacterium]
MKKVCVLGLGYVGLPTACMLAVQGHEVVGVDVKPEVVHTISNGGIHIEEAGLKTMLQAAINSRNLVARTEVEPADVFIIAVPTPLAPDKRADTSYVERAARSIVPVLEPGNLVILESTAPPGTTANLLCQTLSESGLKPGSDFHIAQSPERVLPGNIFSELVSNDRVIGGITLESAEAARELYKSFVEGEILLTDATTAEMVKLVENTFRDVNVALANELAMVAAEHDVNIFEIIDLANRHTRVNVHQPGPGVGGHCIPIDPWFIIEESNETGGVIRRSRQVNDSMPGRIIKLVQDIVGDEGKITVWGVAYKGNVDDTRETPAVPIIDGLKSRNYTVGIFDFHVKNFDCELDSLEGAVDGADAILLLAGHREFKYLDPYVVGKRMRRRIVIDTRNCLDPEKWKNAGFEFYLFQKKI